MKKPSNPQPTKFVSVFVEQHVDVDLYHELRNMSDEDLKEVGLMRIEPVSKDEVDFPDAFYLAQGDTEKLEEVARQFVYHTIGRMM